MSNFLAEIKARYPDCNLLIPQSSNEQVSPFMSYNITQVQADLSENSGDVFKVGSTKIGNQYVDVFSISKPLLNKMAQAAGISFDPGSMHTTFSDNNTVVTCSVAGSIRRPDGTNRTEVDSKTISLKDEEDKYRMEAEEKARNGILDPRQVEAAEKLYSGKRFQATNKYNKPVTGFLIDEKDRKKYIDRYVRTNLAQLRKTWAEKAMTGAKLRVIRSLLGMKGTYTMEELKKPFVIPTVVFTPNYNDPMVQQIMMLQAMGGANSLFGMQSIGSTSFPQISPMEVIDEGFVSERTEEDDYREEFATVESVPEPVQVEQYPVREPAEQPVNTHDDGQHCSQCGAPITQKVFEYSVKRYGDPLCFNCQKTRGNG